MRANATRVATLFLALFSLAAPPAANAGLVATYQFQNTLAADEAGAPALVPLNSGSFVSDTPLGQSRTVYERLSSSDALADQSALRLDTASLGLTSNNYSVEIVFTFTDNSGAWRRVLNSYDPSNLKDPGLYVGPDGRLNLYSSGSHPGGPSLTNGTYYDVVLSVAPTGEKAYLNGALAVDIGTTPDAIATHFLNFFLDEVGEYGDGRVALIRVFDSALTADEVAKLHNGGNPFPASAVPEPSTLVGGCLAGLFGLVLARRRRKV